MVRLFQMAKIRHLSPPHDHVRMKAKLISFVGS